MKPRFLLYDLLCKKGQICWSPNVNKVRLVLNYKRILYDVTWLDFPDIERTLRADGAAPGDPEVAGVAKGMTFTLPTLLFPDGRFVKDTARIAHELDMLGGPLPSLHLQRYHRSQIQSCVNGILRALLPEIIPRVRDHIVTDAAKAMWLEKRERFLGQSIETFVKKHDPDDIWKQCEVEIGTLLSAHDEKDGPYLSGPTPSYSDFVVVGMLQYLRMVDEESLYKRIVSMNSRLEDLYNACSRWL